MRNAHSHTGPLQWAALAGVLLVTSALRLPALESIPPSLSADEASNAYDGYCLLKTGADRWGARWPIVLRAFGDADYRPALLAYLTVPFQALLGPDLITTASRLPSAICGVLTVLCVYLLARRVFDRTVALLSAALLAVMPWHVVLSRLGHESALTPLFPPLIFLLLHLGTRHQNPLRKEGVGVLLVRESLLAPGPAGIPSREPSPAGWHGSRYSGTRVPNAALLTKPLVRDSISHPPADASFNPAPALPAPPPRFGCLLAAGAAIGLSAYTYSSLKLLVPALLIAAAIIYRRDLIAHSRTRRGKLALGGLIFSALLVAAPMLWLTLTQWDHVNARAEMESLFHREPTFAAAAAKTFWQYLDHFGLDWLFVTGHLYVDLSPHGFGQLPWIMLPLLPAGVFACIRRRRANPAYVFVLAWLLLYPIASATTKGGVNAARAAGGLVVFALLSGIALDAILTACKTSNQNPLRQEGVLDRTASSLRAFVPSCLRALALLVTVADAARFAHHYFAVYPHDPEVQARYQVELRQAMDYLRPRLNHFDQVFISDARSMSRNWHTSEAYIYPLAYLPIVPAEFHAAPKQEVSPPDQVAFHFIAQFGRLTFLLTDQALAAFAAHHPTARVLLLARPGEILGSEPVQVLRRAMAADGQPGEPCLELYVFDFFVQRPRLAHAQPGG